MNSIPVTFSDKPGYSIVVGNGLLGQFLELVSPLRLGQSIMVVTHPSLKTLYAEPLMQVLASAGYRVTCQCVDEGETSKSLAVVQTILDQLVHHKFERNDTVLALGGGVVGDLTGFAASIYLRGIRFIQVPTTLLAQVDAAIGGKTGVNHPSGKNLIGSFYQPALVACDIDCLTTLSKRDLRSGLAEIIKYGVIRNAPLFDYLVTHMDRINRMDPKADHALWRHLVEESARDKAYVVSADEKESDLRAILNFGHTIGHGIEAACSYGTYTHGECVAIGMIGASFIAREMGLCSPDVYDAVFALCQAAGFDCKAVGVSKSDVFAAMTLDKKVKQGVMRFVLPTRLGVVEIRNDVSESLVKAALDHVIIEENV